MEAKLSRGKKGTNRMEEGKGLERGVQGSMGVCVLVILCCHKEGFISS